jgi:cell division transport system ATP-binding protein
MIRFDQVTKTYSGTSRPALNGVDLEVLKGEFVFLVGASGSGKSSFLRLVLKEERPSKGKIHVLGQELNSLPSRKVPYFRRSLGVVFQDFRLLPQKTVFDNVAFSLQVIGKSKGFIQEAVPDVLKMVGLAGKQGRFPHELSGGEQQRVAIARAIVNKPAILLADEPTGNLDPATSAGIMALLSTINANGTTVLMATHDSGIVDQMKRRVIELVSGQVVRDERAGGYQTQAIPLQTFDLSGPLPTGAPTASLATAKPPAPSTKVEIDDHLVALDDDPDEHPPTPIEIPVAPPRVVAAPQRNVTAPVTAAPRTSAAPGDNSASDPASPPPLNEPGRRA